mmetsp:Transcript_14153/g.17184  ORF Transcript_14153/g.17184 Transcript_14153/m.17184 type:complete len:92 (+) Transcript_14153:104-379(+)
MVAPEMTDETKRIATSIATHNQVKIWATLLGNSYVTLKSKVNKVPKTSVSSSPNECTTDCPHCKNATVRVLSRDDEFKIETKNVFVSLQSR